MSKSERISINNLIEKIKSNKKVQYSIIAILLAIVLLIFVFGFNTNKEESASASDQISLYVKTLEEKLTNILSNVEGAGNVSVVITVESGMETVLALKTTTKESSNGVIETETSPIIINGKTVVVKELYPKVIGVLIVAQGAGNISVMNKLQQATISLFDININQIEILSMK